MAGIEQEIIEQIKAAGLRLRFDKVVVRLAAHMKAALADLVPEGEAVIFTVTAPIRVPGKTALALEKLARDGSPGGEINGNQVRLRRVTGLAPGTPKVLGFVHNPDSDAGLILALAEARLQNRAHLP